MHQRTAEHIVLRSKGRLAAAVRRIEWPDLQGRFDLKAPGFQEGLGDVFRILITAGPFAQPRGPQVLVRREFELANHLFKFGDRRSNRPNRLRLAPVRISASLCHDKYVSYLQYSVL